VQDHVPQATARRCRWARAITATAGCGREPVQAFRPLSAVWLPSAVPFIARRWSCTVRNMCRCRDWLIEKSVLLAELAVEQHGQLVGKRAEALATVYARQLVQQPGRNRSLGGRQRQRVFSRPATIGETIL
jgi:hypothetical protein